jgi:hypothetical protein
VDGVFSERHARVVSERPRGLAGHPAKPGQTVNVVEFYYPEAIAHFERDFVEAQQAAYVETAAEDTLLCMRMDRGRRALYRQGLDDAGPYQSPLEDAEMHFHEWVRRKLKP